MINGHSLGSQIVQFEWSCDQSGMSRFIEIEGGVGLALVVGFVPGKNLEDSFEIPAAVAKWFWDDTQIIIIERRERTEKVLTSFAEDIANQVGFRNLLIRSAPSFKAWYEIGKGSRAGHETLCGEEFFRNSHVKDLPGEVSTPGAGTPTENLTCGIGLEQFIQRSQSLCAGKDKL